ncbi:MAG: hypothetical protein ACPGLY_15585 [Rubripirellula sp.]
MNGLRGFLMGGMALAMLALTTSTVDAGCFSLRAACCAPQPACCEPQPVCCTPPPPVEMTWCVTDPCDPCCTYEVTACVPACCADSAPSMTGWRKGIFGRKVLTYTFVGCDHCVDVVITKFGRTIVRD